MEDTLKNLEKCQGPPERRLYSGGDQSLLPGSQCQGKRTQAKAGEGEAEH